MKLINQINSIKKLIDKYPQLKGADVSFEVRTFEDGTMLILYRIIGINKFSNSYICHSFYAESLIVNFDNIIKDLELKIENLISENKSDIEI